MLAPTHDNTAPNNVIHLTGILDDRTVGVVRQTLNDLIHTSDGDYVQPGHSSVRFEGGDNPLDLTAGI